MPANKGWQGPINDLANASAPLFANGKLTYAPTTEELPDVAWIKENTPALKKLWETIPNGNATWSSFRNALLKLMATDRYADAPKNKVETHE